MTRGIRDVVPPAGELAALDERVRPTDILLAQATTWTERTDGEVVGEVVRTEATSNGIAHAFYFVVPALDYRYLLFRIEHGVELYPLRIYRLGVPAQQVLDEEGFYEALRRLFCALDTLTIVRQLRAQLVGPR